MLKALTVAVVVSGLILLSVGSTDAGICPDGDRCPSFQSTQGTGAICPNGEPCGGFRSRGGCAHNYGNSVPMHNIGNNWGEWLPAGVALAFLGLVVFTTRWRR